MFGFVVDAVVAVEYCEFLGMPLCRFCSRECIEPILGIKFLEQVYIQPVLSKPAKPERSEARDQKNIGFDKCTVRKSTLPLRRTFAQGKRNGVLNCGIFPCFRVFSGSISQAGISQIAMSSEN